jgi:hypothetical protein
MGGAKLLVKDYPTFRGKKSFLGGVDGGVVEMEGILLVPHISVTSC